MQEIGKIMNSFFKYYNDMECYSYIKDVQTMVPLVPSVELRQTICGHVLCGKIFANVGILRRRVRLVVPECSMELGPRGFQVFFSDVEG